EVVALGDRVREQPVAHRARPRQGAVAARGAHPEDEVLADAHPRYVAEAQGVQGVLHGLALGGEQRGARHHPDLDPVRAHLWPPWGATPRADLGGGGPYASATRSPVLCTRASAHSAFRS